MVLGVLRNIVNMVASVEGYWPPTDDLYCPDGASMTGADDYARCYICKGDMPAMATTDSILACNGIGLLWPSDTAEGCLKVVPLMRSVV